MLVADLVNQFKQQSILVTGDTYIDCEIYGDVSRLAPEAPVPVVKVRSKRVIPGGAANVARNIALLGGHAVLYGNFGNDPSALEINQWLVSNDSQPPSLALPTSSRLSERHRIFASNQQLVQILRRPAKQPAHEVLQPLAEFVAASPVPIHALVIYDQGYGFVTAELLQSVAALAAQYPLKVIVDANPEHVEWYLRADLYTFNAEESLAAVKRLGGSADSVLEAGKQLGQKLRSDILITQGGEGMALFRNGAPPVTIPANRVTIADRAGAGDSATAVLSLCLAAGADLKVAADLANRAAGIVVAKPGIAYPEPGELLNLFHQEISHLLLESVGVKQRLIQEQLPSIESVVKTIIRTYRESRTVYAFGMGSAADANHFITELVGRFLIERKGLPAVSFSTNEILMTSIANDYGYENTFSRQVDAFVKAGDLVAAFSTSGKSANVVNALSLAKSKGATTVGFTGSSAGEFPRLCDICIRVPSDNAPRIQESHLAVVHIICELLEKELALANPTAL